QGLHELHQRRRMRGAGEVRGVLVMGFLPAPRAAGACALIGSSSMVFAQAASAPAPAGLPLAHAQTNAFVDGLLKTWYAPNTRRFAIDGDALADRTQAWCSSNARNVTAATK